MSSNLKRFETDLNALVTQGNRLLFAMQLSCHPELRSEIESRLKDKADEYLKDVPLFETEYQRWYSEALAVVRQLLPDRAADFTRHYEKPKTRKEITYDSYRIEDYLQGLNVTLGSRKIVGKDAAIPQFQQQLAIVAAARARFQSSLFDIRQLVQADLLDSEMDAADLLAKQRFRRAAGAIAGVVLERHLGQVCIDHGLRLTKKHPTIADYNEVLKAGSVIDVPQWRFIQHLGYIRNLCDHARKEEPTSEQTADLLDGVRKITKTVY